jgi:hypothetical protein
MRYYYINTFTSLSKILTYLGVQQKLFGAMCNIINNWQYRYHQALIKEGKRVTPTWLLSVDIAGVGRSR